MKIFPFVLASLVLLAPICHAAPAQPRLVGLVYPVSDTEKPNVWLGGGFFPGKGWRNDAQSKGALLPGVRWQLFGLDGAGPRAASAKSEISDVPGGYFAQLRGDFAVEKTMFALANAGANAQPRLPRAQNLNQPAYGRAVAALLRARGLKVQSAKLTQLMRVDLNGDGLEEVIMAARSRPDYGNTPEEKAGDYSMLAVRYVDKGALKTQVLGSNISKKAVAFSAPYAFELMCCVDVNGDGRMEVVLADNYYEGDGFTVWSFDGRGFKRVITAGWGV